MSIDKALFNNSSKDDTAREKTADLKTREEFLDHYLSNFFSDIPPEHEGEMQAVRGQILEAMESFSLYKSKEAETERRFLLEGYSEYLEEHGFMDSDWREEEPFPIDVFLNSNKR